MAHVFRFRRRRLERVASQRRGAARSRWQAFLLLMLTAGVLAIPATAGAAFGIYQFYTRDLVPPEQAIAEASIGTSIAYDRNGKFLYEFVDPLGGLRNPVPLEEISPWLVRATISTEDASFYENPGVNIRGLIRAAIENLTPFGPGFLAGSGGSSITQQLVKNVYVPREERFDRKIERKIKETVLALELKRRYDDDQILEWYLNQIYYGNFAFGAQAAAQRYFGKPASELTLAEAAMLAGIPQAPGAYSPVVPANRQRAVKRQHQVLDLMVKHGYITRQQAEEAKQEELTYATPKFDINAPHFVFYVGDIVAKMCKAGLFEPPAKVDCDRVVFQGDLRITTTLDLELQRTGEQIVEKIISANEQRYNGHNGAIVAIDPKTGQILAMVGSRDFFRKDIEGQVNITTSPRSHGSTMKVFTYLTAFQQGWVPSSTVLDAPLVLDGRPVNNWNYSHMGPITIRKALSQSVNVPAVRTVMEVGEEEFVKTAHRMGITDLTRKDCGPTITLGACEVKLLDMVYAYSVVANNGVMKGMPSVEDLPEGFRPLDPASVLRIEDSSGNVLYEFKEPEEQQVIKPAYAYMITDILSRQAITWSRLTIGRPAASKTGTSEEFKDNVVLGYTPGLVVGVWMGNADGTPMVRGTFSAAGAGPMWRQFMLAALKHLEIPSQKFEVPDDVVIVSCGGRQEVFALDEVPKHGSICRLPVPRFPLRPKKTPTPSPAPSPTPTPTPTPTPVPSPPPEISPTPPMTETAEPPETPVPPRGGPSP